MLSVLGLSVLVSSTSSLVDPGTQNIGTLFPMHKRSDTTTTAPTYVFFGACSIRGVAPIWKVGAGYKFSCNILLNFYSIWENYQYLS